MTLVDAAAPPEARGVARDEVALVVATGDGVLTTQFRFLGEHLRPGDLLVVNTSATLAAAVDGRRGDGTPVVVHFSSEQDDGSWVVEVRPAGRAHGPLSGVAAGERLALHERTLTVVETLPGQERLHRSRVDGSVRELLWDHGRPIRYAYVAGEWPLTAYQTAFARHPGSAEMPSAGRPFTPALVTDLVTRGVHVAPVTLHTGVSSQEPGEPPQPEPFEVPESTGALVEHVRARGGRVVAVGTTVTRALESAARGMRGWTDLVLGPGEPAQVVDGLVTGWHAPGASHLELLEAVAGAPLVQAAYAEAGRQGLQLHEFGDSCLLLP